MTKKISRNEPACSIDLLRTWEEIADFLGVHRETAQRWGRTKGLPYARLMGRTVISTRKILNYWKNGQTHKRIPTQSVDPMTAAILGKNQYSFIDQDRTSEMLIGWEQIAGVLGVNKLTAQKWVEAEGMPVGWAAPGSGASSTTRKPYTTCFALQYWINWKIIKKPV